MACFGDGVVVVCADGDGVESERDCLQVEVLRDVPGFEDDVPLAARAIVAGCAGGNHPDDDIQWGLAYESLCEARFGESGTDIALGHEFELVFEGDIAIDTFVDDSEDFGGECRARRRHRAVSALDVGDALRGPA